ncbi:membrane transporter [Cordyceps fumosorosea ARSEF 2679]|uniref:Membrane transporter n=1 Tax=Cordyceps fumosorosea (strain ARSEF 2679) TaxID=1081104 RepID=A0A167MR84_CORFA|nr:membrane transporter [Cordyceps fumosorosea ARSEF 2679]OAA54667.1 membrane transporter [Cordyceps fumosorosea ARSEF 2679]
MACQQPVVAPDSTTVDPGHSLVKFLSRASNRHDTSAAEQGISASNNTSIGLTDVEIERLGRARPACFATWWAEIAFVITVVSSMVMSEYWISGFNIILPPVSRDLGMADAERTWPASVVNLTTASLLLVFARLADMHGGRTVFLAGHAWMCAWCIIAGFSKNGTMLIVCRAMQGVGAAAFVPAGLALLGQTYRPGPRKNLVFAVWGALACVGFYVGIFMGAVTAQFLTWRWFFWIGAMLVACIVAAGFLSIPRDLHALDPTIKMDWLGAATIVPGLTLVVFALTDGGQAPQGWKTPYIYVLLVVGLLFLAAAVYVQGWVSAQPLLPADLFRPKYMKRLCVVLFCAYGTFGLFLFYISFYIETVLHMSPILTAAWFTPLAVGGMVLAVTGGFIMHLLPNRILLLISTVGFLVSVLLPPLIPDQTGPSSMSTAKLYWAYIFPAMLCGTIGVDIMFNVTNVFITTAMPHRHQNAASGLINSLLYLGQAFWLGIAELAVSASVQTQGAEKLGLRAQYQIGFWLGVGLSALALLLTATVRIGSASAALTADEKAALSEAETQEKP